MDEVENRAYQVFAWGYGYVGVRPNLPAAQRLASDYEGARIIVYDRGAFRVVAELGLYAAAGSGKR
jgi:hypothetical protein